MTGPTCPKLRYGFSQESNSGPVLLVGRYPNKDPLTKDDTHSVFVGGRHCPGPGPLLGRPSVIETLKARHAKDSE